MINQSMFADPISSSLLINSWCPHCQHFRPRYSEFAKKLNEFTTQVEVFAVSCVPYDKVCKQNGVKGFPTVKLFPANSINGTKIETNNNITIVRPLLNFTKKQLLTIVVQLYKTLLLSIILLLLINTLILLLLLIIITINSILNISLKINKIK